MCEFGGWKVKGKRMGPRSQRDVNMLRVRMSARKQRGENAGFYGISPISLNEAACGPFIVQESYLQVETASAKGDKVAKRKEPKTK
jgi:hypothetical protein